MLLPELHSEVLILFLSGLRGVKSVVSGFVSVRVAISLLGRAVRFSLIRVADVKLLAEKCSLHRR